MPPSSKTVEEVRSFWEKHPLWSGESRFASGSREFFEEHRRVVIGDCMAGRFDERYLPKEDRRRNVLDLGCGPGFWTVELARYGCKRVVSADLTEQALRLTEQRCAIYGLPCETSRQNAESMTFDSSNFSHVNCQGVIHHTPDTQACIREIHRVLEVGGTASVSVYYKNPLLRAWPVLKWPSRLLGSLAPRLSGRGRESILRADDVNEIVRLYDGAENPLGKAYSAGEFSAMLDPFFEITDLFLHFFPARAFPVALPGWAHRWLDQKMGFMIVASLVKKA